MMERKIKIRLLHVNGCPSAGPTAELIKKIASDMKLDIQLEDITITTQEEAIEKRFFGSPTVQINGKDIDPTVGNFNAFTLA